MRSRSWIPLLTVLSVLPAGAATVSIEADRDATLIEDPAGALANGSGPNFFVGRNNQTRDSIRRALVRFDVAAAVPPGALIEQVELTLEMLPSNPEPQEIGLHRVLADWSEGPSSSAGGQGRPSEPGDVTWLHTVYDVELWVHPGSQFAARESARLEVGSAGSYSWTSTNHLVQDARLWLHAPRQNFGWVLIGDETRPQTAKSFASRESADPSLRPLLVVIYSLPGEH